MLKLYINIIVLWVIISGALSGRKNNSIKTTTSDPLTQLLDKFHQNDYKISYEWSEFVRSDKRFAKFEHHTFKYNRTTTAINATFYWYFDFGYEIEVIVQAYKFMSNEYRIFPIHFEFNLCEATDKSIVGFDKFTKSGNFTCPFVKGGIYHYYNWNPEERSFPPFIPNGRYMIELQTLYRSQEIVVTRNYWSVYRPIV